VIVDGDDLYGDGVNIAARIEALADAGGVLVSNTVYDHVRDRLPFLFEDLGEHRVKNIARPLRVCRVARHAHPRRGRGEGGAAAARQSVDRGIAVRQSGGDPEQEYFVDGMVEEITTAIARLPRLFVIARNSSFAYKGKSPDLRQVGRELGVRYLLEGAVRKAGNRQTVSTRHSTTSSNCRTRWRRTSSARSSRSCANPRSSARRASRQRASMPTISASVPWRSITNIPRAR
jgi:adenylate cyclase